LLSSRLAVRGGDAVDGLPSKKTASAGDQMRSLMSCAADSLISKLSA
jgi:hypothetical protein